MSSSRDESELIIAPVLPISHDYLIFGPIGVGDWCGALLRLGRSMSISDLPSINISSHNPTSVSIRSPYTGTFSLCPRISFNALSALFPFTCFSFSSCLTISVAHASMTSHAGAIWCRMTRTKQREGLHTNVSYIPTKVHCGLKLQRMALRCS